MRTLVGILWGAGVHSEDLGRLLVEFETCPSWVPAVDKRQWHARIVLKTVRRQGFDHSDIWPRRVRSVSRLGSQISILQVGFELPPSPAIVTSALQIPGPVGHGRNVAEDRFT
jgi:hypothetical protein